MVSKDDVLEINDDILSTVRQSNRVLRAVNRSLRQQVQDLKAEKDNAFTALCETETEAERALGELWGSGEFECGPQNYDEIVMTCISRLRECSEYHKNPISV